jgi:hypothetical protein
MSRFLARTFLTCKKGEEWTDCQDSIYPAPEAAGPTTAYAVADGATTSFFPRQWAQILTRRFATEPERVFGDWARWLQEGQEEWLREIDKVAHSPTANFLVLNGFLAKRSAAATFVGLTITELTSEGWSWRAILLGDSCLFRLQPDGLVSSWNLKLSSEFNSLVSAAESRPTGAPTMPIQFGSEPPGNETLIQCSESLVLTTDAMAKWLLKRAENGQAVWGTILGLQTAEAFQQLVDQARGEMTLALDNDDVALAVLIFGDTPAIFANQTFLPNPHPRAQSKALQPPVYPVSQPAVDAISADAGSAISNRPRRLSPTARRVCAVVFVMALGVLLLRVIALQSRVRKLTRENELLRAKTSSAAVSSPSNAAPFPPMQEIGQRTDPFIQYLENLQIDLRPFRCDGGEVPENLARPPHEPPPQ